MDARDEVEVRGTSPRDPGASAQRRAGVVRRPRDVAPTDGDRTRDNKFDLGPA